MMIRLHEELEIARAPAEVFRYLADFSTIEQWDPGVYRAEKRTPGKPGVGTEYELILNSFGRRVPIRYRTIRFEEGRLLKLEGDAESFSVVDIIGLEPVSDSRTRLSYTAEITFKGSGSILERMLRPSMVRLGKAAVEGLRQALELPETPPVETAIDKFKRATILPGAWDFSEKGYLAMERKGLSNFMDGKTVVITGPTSGLGLAAACEFSRLGATVALVGRDLPRLQKARDSVLAFSGATPETVKLFEAELTLKSELKRVSVELREQLSAIDVLVHNAGALFEDRQVTSEGLEKTFAIHVMAPWILTEELREPLLAGHGRVILVSSGGLYTQPLDVDALLNPPEPFQGATAYAVAKRAQLGLLRHWSGTPAWAGVGFYAMHPGWARTPGVTAALPRFDQLLGRALRDARMGADTVVWLGSAPEVAGHSGLFWFDRKPRPTEVLPGTRIRSEVQVELISMLGRLS